jgi:ankyrin repeat protein
MTLTTGIEYWCLINAIHGACEGDYKDIVEILIKHNVDINQRGGYLNQTPIFYACRKGHTDIVQILLKVT